MKTLRWRLLAVASLGLGLAAGCQTWNPEAALTLPTARYLDHQPQYIPQSPPFPLARELATIEEAAAQQIPAAVPPGAAYNLPGPTGPER